MSATVETSGLEEVLCTGERLVCVWLTANGRDDELCVIGGLGSVWYTIR